MFSKNFKLDNQTNKQKNEFMKFFNLSMTKTIYDNMIELFNEKDEALIEEEVNINQEKIESAEHMHKEIHHLKDVEKIANYGERENLHINEGNKIEDKGEENSEQKKKLMYKELTKDYECFILAFSMDPFSFLVSSTLTFFYRKPLNLLKR